MPRWLRIVAWVGAALAVALLIWLWPSLRPAFSGGVSAAADLLSRTGRWGPPLVILLQMLQAVISPLPSWPVTVAAGALYGAWPGTLLSLTGACLGAALNFSLARRLGVPLVRRHLGPRWLQAAARLGPVHFLILSLMGRLIPVASFDVVAYVAGISRISLPAFLGVAALGQAPALYAYAYVGRDLAAAREASLAGSLVLLLLVVLALGGRRLWQRLMP